MEQGRLKQFGQHRSARLVASLAVVHACAMHGDSHGDTGCKAELTGTCALGAQFNSASLNRHLSQAYNANVGGYSSRGFVEVWPARQAP